MRQKPKVTKKKQSNKSNVKIKVVKSIKRLTLRGRQANNNMREQYNIKSINKQIKTRKKKYGKHMDKKK